MSSEMEAEPKLQPGAGFHLQDDGQWKVEQIPLSIIKDSKVSGKLTIFGYRCTVFETPEGDQWAQKSIIMTNTASAKKYRCSECGVETEDKHSPGKCEFGPNEGRLHKFYDVDWHKEGSTASRIAARWLEAKGKKRDVTSLVKKIMDRPGDDRNYEKEISKYGKKVRKAIPKVVSAFERLMDELNGVSESLADAGHEKVSGHHAEKVRDDIGKAISTAQVAIQSLSRNLNKRAQEWDPED